MPTLILSQASINVVSKKKDGEECTIIPISSSYIETIFALLVEPIAIQIQFSEIQVEETNLERLLFQLYCGRKDLNWGLDLALILDNIYVGPHKNLK